MKPSMKAAIWISLMAMCVTGCHLETMCEYGTGTNYCDGKKSDEPLFACIDGFWVEQIGQTCGCVENQCVTNSDSNIGFRCIKDMSMPCLDGNALTSCSSNTECGKCLNGERRCSADGAFVEECRKGNWQLKAECDFGCSNQSCIEAKPCTESTECEDGEICTDGYCIKKCENGERTCSKDHKAMLVCKNDLWIDIECTTPKLCSDGDCSLSCKNGEAFCIDESHSMVCENEGWSTKKCPEEARCIGGVCVGDSEGECNDSSCLAPENPTPGTPLCTNGEKRCSQDNSNQEVCESGKWVKKTCADGLGCENGNCKAKCKEGVKDCSSDGSEVVICQNGQWISQETCVNDDKCSGGKCQCVENQQKCAVGENTVLRCMSGKWENWTNCSTKACIQGECSDDVCYEGRYACPFDITMIDHCEGGKWVTHPCGDGMICDQSECICASNKYAEISGQCHVQECINRVFQPQKACGTPGPCQRDGSGTAVGCKTCVNGTISYQTYQNYSVCIDGVMQHANCSNQDIFSRSFGSSGLAGYCENNGTSFTTCFYMDGNYQTGFSLDTSKGDLGIMNNNVSCTFSMRGGVLASEPGVCTNGSENGGMVCENGQWAAK